MAENTLQYSIGSMDVPKFKTELFDNNCATNNASDDNSESSGNERVLVDEEKVSQLLIDWMNVLPVTNIIERARLLKLAAEVDDADEVIVCDLILFKDILDTQLNHNLLNADKRYEKRLMAIEREYQRKRSACEKQRLSEKQALVSNTHRTLLQNKGPALTEELYKKSVNLTPETKLNDKRRRNRVASSVGPTIVYELNEKDTEEDLEELRRSIAEQTANKLLNCLIEYSAKKMNAQMSL